MTDSVEPPRQFRDRNHDIQQPGSASGPPDDVLVIDLAGGLHSDIEMPNSPEHPERDDGQPRISPTAGSAENNHAPSTQQTASVLSIAAGQERDTSINSARDRQWLSHPTPAKTISTSQDEMIKAVLHSKATYSLPSQLRFRPTIEDLKTCYFPSELLNDEIINAYLQLLTAKSRSGDRMYAFNTFFFSTLQSKGYSGVSRWASEVRGEKLLLLDTIFIPIHQGCHWTLVVVHPRSRIIIEFNSLGTTSAHAHLMKQFLDREVAKGTWKVQCGSSPKQRNGHDCGVFVLTSARCIALGLPIKYTQDDIPNMRKIIVGEIIRDDIYNGKKLCVYSQ